MSAHHFDPSILRAYDIRGIYQQTLTDADAFAIGLAFTACMDQRGLAKRIAVGRDGRLSSPSLAIHLIDGLVAGGAEIFDIGYGPTPMLYYANEALATEAAIQVTGSHNPPTHNGFKMVMGGAVFFGDDITRLGAVSAAGSTRHAGGQRTEISIFDDYVARILQGADVGTVTAVWDCGNGASGEVTDALTRQLSGTHHVLFSEIDGTFPNHHPNPVDPETLDMLRDAVTEHNADLGIGFDGDGDRIGLIDAKGRQVPGDLLTAYLAMDIAPKYQNRPMLLDVKSSDMAMSLIAAAGADAQIWKTGHSHMKKRMAELDVPLAGEMSGHIFIKDDYYGFDDAIYVALRVLGQMHRTGQSITAFMDSLPPQFATPELRIECDDSKKFAAMDALASFASTRFGTSRFNNDDMSNISLVDGVRVRSDSGWWLVRASNTEAALVARAEGTSQTALDSLIADLRETLDQANLTVKI